MPFKLIAPVSEEFKLSAIDEEYSENNLDKTPTIVVIRQGTQSDNEKRSKIISRTTQILGVVDPGETKIQSDWSYEELKKREVMFTLIDCNIEDYDGKSLFKFRKDGDGQNFLDMSIGEFDKAWGKLPPSVASEIYRCVLEVNVDWRNPFYIDPNKSQKTR